MNFVIPEAPIRVNERCKFLGLKGGAALLWMSRAAEHNKGRQNSGVKVGVQGCSGPTPIGLGVQFSVSKIGKQIYQFR